VDHKLGDLQRARDELRKLTEEREQQNQPQQSPEPGMEEQAFGPSQHDMKEYIDEQMDRIREETRQEMHQRMDQQDKRIETMEKRIQELERQNAELTNKLEEFRRLQQHLVNIN
jgi:predicted RNase H-like nuclease (RuvC/YqgF family)